MSVNGALLPIGATFSSTVNDFFLSFILLKLLRDMNDQSERCVGSKTCVNSEQVPFLRKDNN